MLHEDRKLEACSNGPQFGLETLGDMEETSSVNSGEEPSLS